MISEGKDVSVGMRACMPLINQIKSNRSVVDSHFAWKWLEEDQSPEELVIWGQAV